MKARLFTVLIMVFALVAVVSAQVSLDAFETSADSGTYEINVEGAPSRIDLANEGTDFVEGAGSMYAKYVIGEFHQWGSYGNLIYRTDSTTVMDWTVSDSLSIWLNVLEAPKHPEWMVFRIHIADRPTADDPLEEYIYENATILDTVAGWINLRVPLYERPTDGATIPNDEGFVLFPTSWGGGSYNNSVLDRDAIVGWNISAVTSGWDPAANLPADSVTVLYDGFERFGARAVPYVFFNGMALNGLFDGFWWGGAGSEIVEGAGATAGTNALKWTQGDPWNGFGWNITEPLNMLGGWMTDSMKIKIKTSSAITPVRIQFEGGGGKVGHVFTPTGDDQWHSYAFALKDFVFQDGTTSIDTTAINVLQILSEGNGVGGQVVWIDDWWTGNPDFDVIPPEAPSNLLVVSDVAYSNLVTWSDVPGESNETYNVYYSKSPITDVKAEGVEVVEQGYGVAENSGNVTHLLYSPLGDSTVSFYYAVVAVDEAGNESTPVVSASPVSNTAKGIPTISLAAPASFAADGDLSEWAGIQEFRLIPSEGGHIATNWTVTDDNDLSTLLYLAADADYLYIAFDVTDDIVDYSASNSWEQDSPDLFLGLYDQHGRQHGSYGDGSTPDYHFRLNHDQMIIDNRGGAVVISASDADYYWDVKFPFGYVIEARISWADLATLTGDSQFAPAEGYRIPFNFNVNDSDAPGVREGIMSWSIYDNDTAWQSPSYWLYTWIGTTDSPTGILEDTKTPLQYALTQNYPNPFNPVTSIEYALQKPGQVTLDVYNMLGQKVASLVNGKQTAGTYKVDFNASQLASGVYFYRLQSNEFSKIRKMVLLK